VKIARGQCDRAGRAKLAAFSKQILLVELARIESEAANALGYDLHGAASGQFFPTALRLEIFGLRRGCHYNGGRGAPAKVGGWVVQRPDVWSQNSGKLTFLGILVKPRLADLIRHESGRLHVDYFVGRNAKHRSKAQYVRRVASRNGGGLGMDAGRDPLASMTSGLATSPPAGVVAAGGEVCASGDSRPF